MVPRPLAYTSHKRGITIHLRPTHHVSIRLLHSTIRQHFSKAQKHQSHAPSCLRIRFRLELARRLPQPLLEGLDGTGVVPTLPLALHAMFRGSRCYMEMIRAVRIEQCWRPNSLSALCVCPPTTVRSRAIVISSFCRFGSGWNNLARVSDSRWYRFDPDHVGLATALPVRFTASSQGDHLRYSRRMGAGRVSIIPTRP